MPHGQIFLSMWKQPSVTSGRLTLRISRWCLADLQAPKWALHTERLRDGALLKALGASCAPRLKLVSRVGFGVVLGLV